jgi:hypothetical protein
MNREFGRRGRFSGATDRGAGDDTSVRGTVQPTRSPPRLLAVAPSREGQL